MTFFKKEKNQCSCCNSNSSIENSSFKSSGQVIKSVKVLGSGCINCKKLFKNTQDAIDLLGIDLKAEYITDLQKIMEYGVLSMPALIINDTAVSSGRVLTANEVMKFLQ